MFTDEEHLVIMRLDGTFRYRATECQHESGNRDNSDRRKTHVPASRCSCSPIPGVFINLGTQGSLGIVLSTQWLLRRCREETKAA